MRARGPALVLFGPALVWGLAVGLGSGATVLEPGPWRAIELHRSASVGDAECRGCHRGNWDSWHRSYHRTMTQSLEGGSAAVVLAPFAGEQLVTAGFVATMDRDAEGRPRLRVHAEDHADEPLIDAVVTLAVGSHRYQQYVARIDRGGGAGELWRLPVAWHIGESRWIHMGSAFLEPDPSAGEAAEYLRHLSRYNDNCIFCHNTEPVPGMTAQGGWRSEVAQWGIACAACHGPGEAHVQRHNAPLGGVLAALGDDGSIVDPEALPGARAAELCGRCHGQRIGHDIAAILRDGDGFVPGDVLGEVSRPIFADSHIGADETPVFAERFWPDGTPRLSAHEYQGLLLSPCYDEGRGLGCESCHDMHGAEPSMQLRADWDPVDTCLGCHPRGQLGAAHGGHGDAVDCTGCHMPRTSYGLLEGMISHRVSTPDPGAWVGRDDMPDACTQCHVDRSRRWAAEAMAGLGSRGSTSGGTDAREAWGSRVLLDLQGGDPIQRALAAHALARPGVPVEPAPRLSWLIDALADDYGAVRWIAWRAARSLATDAAIANALAAFDPGAPPESRLSQWQALRTRLGPGPFADAPERQLELEASRDATAIVIGE